MTPIKKSTIKLAAWFLFLGALGSFYCAIFNPFHVFYPLAMGATSACVLLLVGAYRKGI